MKSAKLFMNGQSQAVRLPREFRFGGKEVFVKKVGNAVILLPKDNSWDALINSLSKFSDDFMQEREQGDFQER
ncbi:MAG: type II toxin-antitoxin system VapB family antitoxin [Candidatus Ozemobacteraceae bacterium]